MKNLGINSRFILFILLLFVSTVFTQFEFRCGQTEEYCRNDQTCCLVTEGVYGCCAYINATCCEDGRNCCPHGYVCNLAKMRCDKKSKNYFLEILIPGETMADNNGLSNLMSFR